MVLDRCDATFGSIFSSLKYDGFSYSRNRRRIIATTIYRRIQDDFNFILGAQFHHRYELVWKCTTGGSNDLRRQDHKNVANY